MIKKNDFRIVLLVLIVFVSANIGYAATIYQNDLIDGLSNKNMPHMSIEEENRKKTPMLNDDITKPTAETTIDPSILYTSKITYEKEKKKKIGVIIQKEVVTDMEKAAVDPNEIQFTYIRHRDGYTNVTGNYQWEDVIDEDNIKRTKLLIYQSPDHRGLPHYAYSGFYFINDSMYCFDSKGYLIKGFAKDERNNIYNLDPITGKLVEWALGG